MATLYVEKIPDQLYAALRKRARSRRRSIAAEVLELLEESIPTDKELKARTQLLRKLAGMRSKEPPADSPRLSTEEMQREDRER
jgi:plasmid stability protein